MSNQTLYKGDLFYNNKSDGFFGHLFLLILKNKKKIILYSTIIIFNIVWLSVLLDWFPMTKIVMLNFFHPRNSAYMRLYNGQESIQHKWVSIDKISVYMKNAVVVAEDENFYEHEGIDFEALKVAWEKNKRKGKIVAGGSTITMQLARNLFLSPKKTIFRKARELYIATLLERMLTKERIMELYLNFAEFGDGIYGIESASQHYFKKSAKNLTRDESAFLVAILPRPKFYEKKRTNLLQKRIEKIKKLI